MPRPVPERAGTVYSGSGPGSGPGSGVGSGAGEGDGLEASRTHVDRLLQAADDAIARALSADSERFLQATRQSGGQ